MSSISAKSGKHSVQRLHRTRDRSWVFDPAGTEGNIVFLHFFIDVLALQPCKPTFLTTRTAWIQADLNRYAGANACTLWAAFTSCGLGTDAANHVDGTAVPPGCD
ncbi:hypothetical protein B0H12DRAFT_1228943 [Mycena haematopus]|nr:hypothetical protein B0H12DRAFT_1228943 [Mycena haematopus]